MARLDFQTSAECSAYSRLLSSIERRQAWEDVRRVENHPDTICHVCGYPLEVKQGRVPVNNFWESKAVDAYNYWQLCKGCHAAGWKIPQFSFDNSITYHNIGGGKTREKRVGHLARFSYPSVVGLNTTHLLIS